MIHKELNTVNKHILERLLEYCKYLYEEEKDRTERLERKLNIFSIFLGGSISGVLVLPDKHLAILFNNSNQGYGM